MTGTVRVPLSRDSVPRTQHHRDRTPVVLRGVPVSRCPVYEGLRRPVSRSEATE